MSALEEIVPNLARQDDTDDKLEKNANVGALSLSIADNRYGELIDRSVKLGVQSLRNIEATSEQVDRTSFPEKNSALPTRIFESPPPIRTGGRIPIAFEKIQEWEGYVVHVDSETFTARLVDLSRHQVDAEEETEFLISDLTRDDQSLLRVGAIFRWVIGYQRYGGGPKQRVSQLAFRRLPAWTRRDFDKAESSGRDLHNRLEWD